MTDFFEYLHKALEVLLGKEEVREQHRIKPLEPVFFYRKKKVPGTPYYAIIEDKIIGVWEE